MRNIAAFVGGIGASASDFRANPIIETLASARFCRAALVSAKTSATELSCAGLRTGRVILIKPQNQAFWRRKQPLRRPIPSTASSCSATASIISAYARLTQCSSIQEFALLYSKNRCRIVHHPSKRCLIFSHISSHNSRMVGSSMR